MTNIELYINQKLCDIQNPESLGIRLNRVLINPAELSSKDAQYSYSITLPSTPVNDAIFSHVNVEEVKNKFNVYHTALLYVDGIRIFEGRFKMSEIDSEGNYKGNLVVPAKKTIKEIFGDKKMNEIGEWMVKGFDTVTETLNHYNTQKAEGGGLQPFIQPLVLYGLLPKMLNEKGIYTGKTIWDENVRLGIEDFPPSINCLKAIEQIFSNLKLSDVNSESNDEENKKPNISGSAFEDSRLTNLYMSYQNPTDYQQEWNWGSLGCFQVKGSWSNCRKDENDVLQFERLYSKNDDGGTWHNFYISDLFRSSNLVINEIKDRGSNVIHYKKKDESNESDKLHTRMHITIPKSGLYKIELGVKLKVRTDIGFFKIQDGNIFIGYENKRDKGYKKNNFQNSRYEVKLLRDFGEGSFDITDMKLDGSLYRDNLPQDIGSDNKTRYFPKPGSDCVQMIDSLQNNLLVNGFRWGEYGRSRKNGSLKDSQYNPLEDKTEGLSTQDRRCRILAAKHGWSWDTQYEQKHKIYSAINTQGYGKMVGNNKVDDEDEIISETEFDLTTSKFKIQLDNASNSISHDDEYTGDGHLNQVVWLEKGEHLTLVSVSDSGHYMSSPFQDDEGFMIHDIDFDLKVTPFKKSYEWITVSNKGTGTAAMNWNDPSDFSTDTIDLSKFLPSEVKVDEWLDNFCKAFNLQLIQNDDGKFELNTKSISPVSVGESVVDLDGKTSLAKANNQPLGLPSEFQLGFKLNKEEEGYVKSKKNEVYDDGGGVLKTGSLDGQIVTQNSNFSYNWFKSITRRLEWKYLPPAPAPEFDDRPLSVPVISDKEVWANMLDTKDYAEMQKKLYTNYAQRFWYPMEQNDNVGIIWKSNPDSSEEIHLPCLSNSLDSENSFSINYYEGQNTLLRNYFNIIATDDSNFTFVECYLTPDEYEQLNGTKLVKLNSDLYYVSAVEGYDPLGKNKTKLKLIRRV